MVICDRCKEPANFEIHVELMDGAIINNRQAIESGLTHRHQALCVKCATEFQAWLGHNVPVPASPS